MLRESLSEVRKTLRLALPVILGQLAGMAMAMIDAAMVGHGVGTMALAGLGFASNFVNSVMIGIFGLVSAQSILIAKAYGGQKSGEAERIVRHGIVLNAVIALAFTGILALLLFNSAKVGHLGQPAEVITIGRPYCLLLSGAFVFNHMFSIVRVYCEAQDRPWLPLRVIAAAILLNVFLNWVLIFGNLGFPALGLTGAGIATILAHLFMLLVMIGVVSRMQSFALTVKTLLRPRFESRIFRSILRIGIPSMLQVAAEVGAFVAAALLMGRIGAVELAAHHITISLAAFSFMVPLGASMAIAIRIGQAAGRDDHLAIRRIGLSAFGATALWMLLIACVFVLLRDPLLSTFSDDPRVLKLARTFLLIAAVFQLFDGLQITATGALRGLEDVKVPTFIIIGVYWLFQLPLACVLAFPIGLEGLGIWIALATGIATAALILTTRFARITHTPGIASPVKVLADGQ